MQKIILPTYGAHIPEIPDGIHKPTWIIPPSLMSSHGLEFDISPLLVCDRLIIDDHAHEYIKHSDYPFLMGMRNTVRALVDEGFIETKNYASIARLHANDLAKATDRAMRDPLDWKEQLLVFMRWWDRMQPALRCGMKSIYDPDTTPVALGIYCYLIRAQGAVNPSEVVRLTKLLHSRKKRWSVKEKQELIAITRPYISYLHLNVALRTKLQCPVLDWDGMSAFYECWYQQTLRAVDRSAMRRQDRIEKAKELFSISLPNIRPKTPLQIVKLLKDRRIKDLRRIIYDAARTGKPLTRDWGEKALIAALQAHERIEGTRRIKAWIARGLAAIPFLSLPAALGDGLIDAIQAYRAKREYKWLYALLDAVR